MAGLNNFELMANQEQITKIVARLKLAADKQAQLVEMLCTYAALETNLITYINLLKKEEEQLIQRLHKLLLVDKKPLADINLWEELSDWRAKLQIAVQGQDASLPALYTAAKPADLFDAFDRYGYVPENYYLTDRDIDFCNPLLSVPEEIQQEKPIYIFPAISVAESHKSLAEEPDSSFTALEQQSHKTFADYLERTLITLEAKKIEGPVTILTPISTNTSGSQHWRLSEVVVEKQAVTSVKIIDSLEETHDSPSMKLAQSNIELAIKEVTRKESIVPIEIQYTGEQRDGFRCGDFVLKAALTKTNVINDHPLVVAKEPHQMRTAIIKTVVDNITNKESQIIRDKLLASKLQQAYDQLPGNNAQEEKLIVARLNSEIDQQIDKLFSGFHKKAKPPVVPCNLEAAAFEEVPLASRMTVS